MRAGPCSCHTNLQEQCNVSLATQLARKLEALLLWRLRPLRIRRRLFWRTRSLPSGLLHILLLLLLLLVVGAVLLAATPSRLAPCGGPGRGRERLGSAPPCASALAVARWHRQAHQRVCDGRSRGVRAQGGAKSALFCREKTLLSTKPFSSTEREDLLAMERKSLFVEENPNDIAVQKPSNVTNLASVIFPKIYRGIQHFGRPSRFRAGA